MPLNFDLPFDELASYTGRNPRPEDFDDYWAAALEELDRTDPAVEIRPAELQPPAGRGGAPAFARYSHLYFTGVGGARIHAKLVEPLGPGAERLAGSEGLRPALLLFHGYAGNSGDWQSKLALAASGFTVAALDCRGQGGLSEDAGGAGGNTLHGHIIRGLSDALAGKGDRLYYRAQYLDTVRLARIVMDLPGVDGSRVGATGWSQGGGLTLACAALEPRIARAAPVFPFLCDFKRVWEMDQAKDAYLELSEWFRRFDPLHEREGEVFRALGYIDVQHLAPRIRSEVLMGTGLMDTICPPSTQFAAYNRISAKKSTLVYPDFGHEDLPGLHDRILDFMGGL